MVAKDSPNTPYGLSNFPKTLPFITKFSTTKMELKAFIGWDGMLVFKEGVDILDALKMYAKQYQNYAQSCGRCTPGKYGGQVLYELLEKIQNSSLASMDDIEKLIKICTLMKDTAKCEVGKTTPKPILQMLDSNRSIFTQAITNNKAKSNNVDKSIQLEELSFSSSSCKNLKRYNEDFSTSKDSNLQDSASKDSILKEEPQDSIEPLIRFKTAITTKTNTHTYISKITAPCSDECPSHVDIPSYIEGVRDSRFRDSLIATRGSMPLAQVCSRVCPHPCESACRRAMLDEPISIMELKRLGARDEFISLKSNSLDYAHPSYIRANSIFKDKKPVCIIGAGPAGLSSAYYLALQGVRVKVYEKLPVLGGEVAVGVPNYRMPISSYNHDIDMLKTLGVEFFTNYEVTKDNINDLYSSHSALILANGTGLSKKIGCLNEDENLKGYLPAIKFMDEVNLAQKFNIGTLPNLKGKKIVCVGGGFTSMDVVRCCIRLGASSVIMLYRRDEGTIIKNTSYEEYHEALEEGVKFMFLSALNNIYAEDGCIKSVLVDKFDLIKTQGSPKGELKMLEQKDLLECDIVIPAVSQAADFSFLDGFGVNITKWNTLEVCPNTFVTNKKGVFGAGDCVSGPLTIVNAVGHGRRVASVIARYILEEQVYLNQDEQMEDLLKSIGVFDKSKEVRGFLAGEQRQESQKLDPLYRASNFEEVNFGFTKMQAVAEAQRCMRCYYISMCVL